MTNIKSISAKYPSLGVEEIKPADIVTAHWVHIKCINCTSYGKNKLCPPNAIDTKKAKKIIAEYSKALLVSGKSRTKEDQDRFMQKVAEFEKDLFLNNHYKIISLMSGPCGECTKCTKECAKETRHCMCAFSVDMFGTLQKLGKDINVLDKPQEYTCYAIILLE